MNKFFGRLAASALLALPLAAHALPFSSLVVFGDSLSDAGDSPSAVISLTKLFPGAPFVPPPPYDGGRFSNGPVGVENLATIRGINNPLQFQDFAVGGATTADIKNTVNNVYLANTGGLADPNALYVVWGGPNNFFGGGTDFLGAAGDIFDSTKALLDAGARMALIPTMPDLSRTPDALAFAAFVDAGTPGAGAVVLAGLHNLSLAYDAALGGVVANLKGLYPNANIIGFDTMGAANEILDNPGAYGFTNVTDSCVATPSCVSDPSQWDHYFYWDGKHPTAAVHGIFGSLLAMTVPEPGTLLLMGLALIGIAATRRRAKM